MTWCAYLFAPDVINERKNVMNKNKSMDQF